MANCCNRELDLPIFREHSADRFDFTVDLFARGSPATTSSPGLTMADGTRNRADVSIFVSGGLSMKKNGTDTSLPEDLARLSRWRGLFVFFWDSWNGDPKNC